jgi:nucleotide-binding universal stress UspA family protein
MKNILVPTDFSENARNALAYAIEIANQFGGNIHLLHTYSVPSRAGRFISVEQYILDDIRPEMENWKQWVRERLKNGDAVSSSILRDNVVHAVSRLAEKEEIDLIVMGTQGASGLKEVFIGSTTAAVMQEAGIPLLAIPCNREYRPIKTIVLAMDDQEISSRQVLAPLTSLASGVNARVLVYHLADTEEPVGIDPSVGVFLSGIEHTLHYEMNGKDLKEGITSFVRDNNADLLCLIRRPQGFFERFFRSSITRMSVFSCQEPLLILIEK